VKGTGIVKGFYANPALGQSTPAQSLDQRSKIRLQFSPQAQGLAAERMRQPQFGRRQQQALTTEQRLKQPVVSTLAMRRVTDDWMRNMLQMAA
jgi:hypothetical protein